MTAADVSRGTKPTAETPLGIARGWLLSQVDKGARCPLCRRHVQVYKRQVNAGMARSLITIYRRGLEQEGGWVHLPTQVPARSREEGKLAYWGLLEEATEPRPDGGRAGWWRVTDKGSDFIHGLITIERYAYVYNDRVMRREGDPRTIQQALGKRFDLRELMGWA